MGEEGPKTQDLSGYWNARLDRIEGKIERVADTQAALNTTLAAQHASLVDHIRRTELLEAAIKPISAHVAVVAGLAKVLGLVALLVSIAVGVLKLVGK